MLVLDIKIDRSKSSCESLLMQSGGHSCAPGCGPLLFSLGLLCNAISRARRQLCHQKTENCWSSWNEMDFCCCWCFTFGIIVIAETRSLLPICIFSECVHRALLKGIFLSSLEVRNFIASEQFMQKCGVPWPLTFWENVLTQMAAFWRICVCTTNIYYLHFLGLLVSKGRECQISLTRSWLLQERHGWQSSMESTSIELTWTNWLWTT